MTFQWHPAPSTDIQVLSSNFQWQKVPSTNIQAPSSAFKTYQLPSITIIIIFIQSKAANSRKWPILPLTTLYKCFIMDYISSPLSV